MTGVSGPQDRELVNGIKTACARSVGSLPAEIVSYLAHVEGKLSIRALARLRACQPSTVMRQIRRVETRRDDPLLDEALDRAARVISRHAGEQARAQEWAELMTQTQAYGTPDEDMVNREARRILRRLCETDAFLAVAAEMEKAVVMREAVKGRPTRTAVVDRAVAHRFALNDWVQCDRPARIARYTITQAGRAALKRLLEEERQARSRRDQAFAEAPSPFRTQHQALGERRVADGADGAERTLRVNLAESPLAVLGRKRDRAGLPYLTPDLIEAGERLREDFEVAQLGPRVTQNWQNFLVPRDRGAVPAPGAAMGGTGADAARTRVQGAMGHLGPGLWDVAFRVCCFLEGLEAAEKRLGWSARSGKVVLRIALQRLADYYGIRQVEVADAAG